MKFYLIAVGTNLPNWVEIGYQHYAKRLTKDIQLQLIEIEAEKRLKNTSTQTILTKEGEHILNAIPKQSYIIALDRTGTTMNSEQLALSLTRLMQTQKSISFLIGGPEGLSENCLNAADARWSLSALTMPHPLVRVVFAEQIYRAWGIMAGHPYHK